MIHFSNLFKNEGNLSLKCRPDCLTPKERTEGKHCSAVDCSNVNNKLHSSFLESMLFLLDSVEPHSLQRLISDAGDHDMMSVSPGIYVMFSLGDNVASVSQVLEQF